MALTVQEKDIAKQVQAQWWSKEDFIEILQDMRKRSRLEDVSQTQAASQQTTQPPTEANIVTEVRDDKDSTIVTEWAEVVEPRLTWWLGRFTSWTVEEFKKWSEARRLWEKTPWAKWLWLEALWAWEQLTSFGAWVWKSLEPIATSLASWFIEILKDPNGDIPLQKEGKAIQEGVLAPIADKFVIPAFKNLWIDDEIISAARATGEWLDKLANDPLVQSAWRLWMNLLNIIATEQFFKGIWRKLFTKSPVTWKIVSSDVWQKPSKIEPTNLKWDPLRLKKWEPVVIDVEPIKSSIPEKQFTPNFKERMVWIRPDIKKRISWKTDQFDEFVNAAKARNLDDTSPSALAHGANKTAETFRKLEKSLNDTWSWIGKFRQKVATVKATPEDIQKAIDKFDSSVAKKWLIIDNKRKIKTSTKRETTLSPWDIKFLQDARDSLVRLKWDPTWLRIIDNRKLLDKKAQFWKKSLEVSSEVDATAKAVRSELAKINRNLIWPEQAAQLEAFENMINVLDEFKGLTSKGKNFEFLLKRVRSERDRLPKAVIEKIKDITWDDLQDFATFSQLATELVWNQAQKGLFRQEIANANLDVLSIMNPKIKAIDFLLEKGKWTFFDPEDIFREATRWPLKNIWN